MPEQLILTLRSEVPAFLGKWERGMALAGYLQHTTAKREDCVQSYEGFLAPLWTRLERGQGLEDFPALLANHEGWADALIQMSHRHRLRGVTWEMFIGCFTTLVQAVEELLLEMNAPLERRLAAIRLIRRHADAAVTLLAGHSALLGAAEVMARLDASNRQLTLEKNKFENIFACTSDLVLVTDAQGVITEASASARRFLGERPVAGEPIWSVLGLECGSMPEVLAYYPPGVQHEIGLYEGAYFFELNIAQLRDVSLASKGFLFLLMDITVHVRQREVLVQKVQERTAELETEKERLVEMNITLRNVISSIKREREEFHEELARTVRQVFLPALERFRSEGSPEARGANAELLGDQLLRLCGGGSGDSDARLLRLTPMELKVCQFIQAGKRTKDISEALTLSVETVQTHRKNIRKKLNLKGGNANLFSFLRAR